MSKKDKMVAELLDVQIEQTRVAKYRGGVRRSIANHLMARWGFSALAGSLSSDGVTIKILVVIQPYTYQTFL